MTNLSKVRNPFTSPDTPTFSDLIVRIDGDRGLNCSKKRQVSSALRKVADWIDKLPHEVPANATYLRRALTNFHPQQAGVTRKRVQNAASDVKFAMRHCGVVLNEATYLAALTPEWQALWDLLDGLKYYRSGLSRFMRFVSAQRITPEDVTQATFDAFLLAVEAEAITKNPRTQHQTACRLWNKCATTIQGWPQACIEVPRYRQTYTLKLEEFPGSFQVDVEAYLARLAHADLFDLSGPKRALRPKTIELRRMQIRQLGSALIHDGMDVEDITALAVIVEHYEAALKWLVNRNGGETSGMIAGIAACLLAIAKYHVKAKPEHLDALARVTSNLTPEFRGLTPSGMPDSRWGFVRTQCGLATMAAPIDLRNEFDSVSLRRLAKRTRDATQSRRLLAFEVYDGGSRTDASDRRPSLQISSLRLRLRTGRAGRWEVSTLEAQRRSPPRTGGGC